MGKAGVIVAVAAVTAVAAGSWFAINHFSKPPTVDYLDQVANELPAGALMIAALPNLDALVADDGVGASLRQTFSDQLDEWPLNPLERTTYEGLDVDPSAPIGLALGFDNDTGEMIVMATAGVTGSSSQAADVIWRQVSDGSEDETSSFSLDGVTWRCIDRSLCLAPYGERVAFVLMENGLLDEARVRGFTQGARASTVEGVGDAMRFRRGSEGAFVVMYQNFGPLLEAQAERSGSELPSFFGDIYEQIGPIGGAYYVEGDDAVVLFRQNMPTEGLLSGLYGDRRDRRSIDHAPSPALVAFQGRVNPLPLYDFYMEMFDGMVDADIGMSREDIEQGIRMAEGFLGMKLRDDLIASFDGNILFVLHNIENITSGADAPGFTLALGVSNSDNIESLLTKIGGMAALAGMPATTSTVGRDTLRTMSIPLGMDASMHIQFGMARGQLWVSSGRTVLTRALGGDIPTMKSDADQRDVYRFMSGESGYVAMYVAIGALLGDILPDEPIARAIIGDGDVSVTMFGEREGKSLTAEIRFVGAIAAMRRALN